MPRKAEPSYETENGVFPKRLKEIMEERGENQTSLARKITEQYVTIQRQTISLYMNGQSKPDTERLTALARVLDVSADWLLGLSDTKPIDYDVQQICKETGLSTDIVEWLRIAPKIGSDGTKETALVNTFNVFFDFSGEELLSFMEQLSGYKRTVKETEDSCQSIKNDLLEMGDYIPCAVLDDFATELSAMRKECRYRRFECVDSLTDRFDTAFKPDLIERLIKEVEQSVFDLMQDALMCPEYPEEE